MNRRKNDKIVFYIFMSYVNINVVCKNISTNSIFLFSLSFLSQFLCDFFINIFFCNFVCFELVVSINVKMKNKYKAM